MNNPSLLVRTGVLASSILLMAGFISFRLGAFDRAPQTSPAGSEEPASGEPAVSPLRMGGSKYMALRDPSEGIFIWKSQADEMRMAGSKSMPLTKQTRWWGVTFIELIDGRQPSPEAPK